MSDHELTEEQKATWPENRAEDDERAEDPKGGRDVDSSS